MVHIDNIQNKPHNYRQRNQLFKHIERKFQLFETASNVVLIVYNPRRCRKDKFFRRDSATAANLTVARTADEENKI